MNERVTQALIRLVVIFVVAGLTALASSLTVLTSAISDPVLASLVLAVGTAVISAILKYLGGVTTQAPETFGRGLNEMEKRPNILSI